MEAQEQDLLPDTLPDNWDPEEADRRYFRDFQTGDLGYLVRREGKTMVRLDRPMEELIRPYRKTTWQPDREHRPMTKFQVTQISFDADRRLCMLLGEHEKAKREWMSLSDAQRIAWAEGGPTDRVERIRLHRSIMKAMAPFMKD